MSGHWEAWSLFVFMLANCGPDGVLDMYPPAISAHSGMPLDAVRKGLAVLEAPDPGSRSAEADGARIMRLDSHRDWGWVIVNFRKYRESSEDPRMVSARQRERRDRLQTSRAVTARHGASREAEAEAEADTPSLLFPAEDSATPNGAVPAVFVFEGIKGDRLEITAEQLTEFVETYPAVDVMQSFRNLRDWYRADPRRRQSAQGMRRRVSDWLKGDQDRGGGRPDASSRRGHRAGADARWKAANVGGSNG